ncbi:hypothetical protein [Deinococcus soli (ex Cha et al. 2016)]|uniref:Ribosomal protein S19E (S16A) n=2 Tax=Deinococcus soli (ex Cha et al. 2016) TaxID=1309411 RepID=A0ACC6KGM9_9DEIO|nr:hypothetical protein [Deinococcus soli (ex Cha et al. 2016)]MDR6219050.1 ribosomal protein S19E (S16A) [Deinococcus soli (ex Cha et al. 2016)]MDR6328847.1 ribosomal protein S19E (S16A) [Deinococcus soli (ex Cha et al. 2016)]MDR6751665.1 ribosomal protein S19E (S16A) [Deinococcus soli (ex Cha et al. 2016)]
MNTIQVKVDNGQVQAVFIDGAPLLELLRACEDPHASKDEHSVAGGYAPTPHPGALMLSRIRDRHFRHHGEVPLLECDCGVTGCWTLTLHVAVTATTVTWSAFRQVHRHHWDYRALGPFQFDRAQYVKALSRARGVRKGERHRRVSNTEKREHLRAARVAHLTKKLTRQPRFTEDALRALFPSDELRDANLAALAPFAGHARRELLSLLEARGLLRCHPQGRRIQIELTPQGRALLDPVTLAAPRPVKTRVRLRRPAAPPAATR